MQQLLTFPNLLVAIGGAVAIAVWLYTHFSKATAANQAARLQTIEKYVGMASAAVGAFAVDTSTKWDDYLAAILKKVDDTLKAQGADPLDDGEKAKATLQAQAMLGASKAGGLLSSPPLPR